MVNCSSEKIKEVAEYFIKYSEKTEELDHDHYYDGGSNISFRAGEVTIYFQSHNQRFSDYDEGVEIRLPIEWLELGTEKIFENYIRGILRE